MSRRNNSGANYQWWWIHLWKRHMKSAPWHLFCLFVSSSSFFFVFFSTSIIEERSLDESAQNSFLHRWFCFSISDGFGLRLQIWDTAGQERFRCLIPSYLRDCHVILVCFDVTNCCTLDNVPDWIELAQKERFGRIKKPLIVLVGNKVDEKSKRQVSTNDDVEFKKLIYCFLLLFFPCISL